MTDEPQSAAAEPLWGEAEGLTAVEPNYRWVMTINAGILGLILLVGVAVADFVLAEKLGWQQGSLLGPLALIILYLVFAIPGRRWLRLGYDLSEDRLRVARGYLWRRDTIVPFGRIQHIDVDQGIIDRGFDLATLIVHTAGTHNSTVSLPGLDETRAAEMREAIRAHIKRETL
ncbi:PH domain-containing protein [Novosphingopyxis sp. YJ-S2-01]|uniref:PH domain-containing protein n=1 Tax=Novosphingopyxis sp. YJ-S2-01 TaxID=2794021 RepID=UPI001E3F66A4|nr:PH domain-containing protein [Novosphingopyxis sp. YJ-S2-01]